MTEPIIAARIYATAIDFERAAKATIRASNVLTRKVANDNRRAASESKAAWEKAQIGDTIRKSFGGGLTGLKGDIAALSGTLATTLGARAALGAADTYARFTNSLKVAGLAGDDLADVQQRLFDIGRDNATDLESLGQLYGSVAQKSRELGATQADILTVTENVALAIRVSGRSSAEAQGALMQMGQALGAGTVRAEEFNSVQEGLPTLLNAMAAASDKYRGSVAKMRADVIAGTLSSAEFMALIKASSATLQGQAAQATLTYGQSITVMKNALVEYVGQTDQSLHVTERLAQGIVLLSENLDKVGAAFAIVTTVIASKYGASLITAGVSSARLAVFQTSMTASLMGTSRAALLASTSMKALNGSMAFFGGPLGIAITAIAVAVYAVSEASAEAAKSAEYAEDSTADYNRVMQESGEFLGIAADNAQRYGEANAGAVSGTNALTSATAALTDETYRLASARAEALRMELQQRVQANRDEIHRLENPSLMTSIGRLPAAIGGAYRGIPHPITGPTGADRERIRQMEDENANMIARGGQLILDPKSYVPDRSAGGGGAGARGARGGGRSIDYEANDAKALHEATMAELASRIALAEALELRHQLQNEQAKAEQEAARREIENDDNLSRAGKDAALTQLKLTQANEDTLRAREQQRELAERTAQIEEDALGHQTQISELTADRYDVMAEMAETEVERARFEALAFDLRQRTAKEQFDLEQDRLAAQRKLLGLDEAEIARRRAESTAAFDAGQRSEADAFTKGQSDRASEGSWGNWFKDNLRDARDFNGQLQDIASQGINGFADAMVNAAMGAGSFKEAVADMGRSVIATLLKMALQFAIVEGIGRLFGMPGLGRAALTGSASAPNVGKNAQGTNHWGGGLTWVGESGPELVNLPQGSGVLSNHNMKAALAAGSRAQPRSANPTTVVNVNLDARDAVLSHTVKEWIGQGVAQGVQVSRTLASKDQQRAGMQSLIR